MANQTTNTNTGRYSPRVSYNQQAPQAINQRLEGKVTIESPDWMNIAEKSIEAFGKVYSKAQEDEAVQRQDAAMNELARKTNAVAEAQRQGLRSPEAAAMEYRALADSYIPIIGEKNVSEVIGRYDAGIRKLDEDKQAALAKADNDYFLKQAAEISAKNPALQRMKPSDNIAFLQNMRNITNSILNYQNALNTMPEGEAKEKMLSGYTQLLKSNIYANSVVQMQNQFLQGKPLTEEDWFIQRQNVINSSMANGLSQVQASVLADEVAMATNQTGSLEDIKRLYKDQTELLQSANGLRLAYAKNQMLSLEEGLWLETMPEPLQELYATRNYGSFVAITKPLMSKTTVDKDGNLTVEGMENITAKELPTLLQSASKLNASNIYNDYLRGKVSNVILKFVNNSNQLSDGSSVDDVDNVINNAKGVRERLNIPLLKKQAMMLKNSSDPEEVNTGEMLEQQIADFEANEQLAKDKQTAAKIVLSMSNLNGDIDSYRAINGLKSSFNAASLRFNEDGELFISNADRGALANAALSFDEIPLVGGEYEEDLKTINQRLAVVEPGVRKEVLKGLGFKQAEAYELPVGDIAERAASRTLNTAKTIANNLYKVSDIASLATTGKSTSKDYKRKEAAAKERKELNERIEQSREAVPGYTGNIDIINRPELKNADGTFSTLKSISFYDEDSGREVLIPTIKVIDGEPVEMSEDEAINWYYGTGEHLGKFFTREEATAMGKRLSNFKGNSKKLSYSISSSTPLAFAGGVRPVEDSDRLPDKMVAEYNMQQDPENITYQRQLMADEAALQERQTRAVANARQAVNRIKEYGTNKETSKDVINAFKELEEAYGSWENIPEDILNDLQ